MSKEYPNGNGHLKRLGELYEVIERNHIYRYPNVCKCGYNGSAWNEMEYHYEICEIYREQLKSMIPKK